MGERMKAKEEERFVSCSNCGMKIENECFCDWSEYE
jgi:hypothetical protein